MDIKRSDISRDCPRSVGFTLVEILIVVVILAILAAIVIPQFTNAAATARENTIKMDLHRIRTQLGIYQSQHDDQYPTLAAFSDQMTLASKADGTTAAVGTSGYKFGPYLTSIPKNPNTSGNVVGNGAVGTSDWYYDETTGDFRANDSVDTRSY